MNEELANISITLNDKGQFVFNIQGGNEDVKKLAYVIINYIKNVSTIDPVVRNKFVFLGEVLPLIH